MSRLLHDFNILYSNLIHELFHALQDRIYPNGIIQDAKTESNNKPVGYSEIEFEHAIFHDLQRRMENDALTASNSNGYELYINKRSYEYEYRPSGRNQLPCCPVNAEPVLHVYLEESKLFILQYAKSQFTTSCNTLYASILRLCH